MRGFTLVELMIVVAILGIIAAIGVPMYTGYVDTSRVTGAHTGLRQIYLQQEQFFTDNNAYYANTNTCAADFTANINTDLFAGRQALINDNYTFCVQQPATTTDEFTAIATEIGATTPRIFTINQNNQVNF